MTLVNRIKNRFPVGYFDDKLTYGESVYHSNNENIIHAPIIRSNSSPKLPAEIEGGYKSVVKELPKWQYKGIVQTERLLWNNSYDKDLMIDVLLHAIVHQFEPPYRGYNQMTSVFRNLMGDDWEAGMWHQNSPYTLPFETVNPLGDHNIQIMINTNNIEDLLVLNLLKFTTDFHLHLIRHCDDEGKL